MADGLQADELDRLARGLARLLAVRMAQERADHDVVEDGHVGKGRRNLKSAADAESRMRFRRSPRHVRAVEPHRSAGRDQVAAKAIEERGFAGAVRPDQADDVAFLDLEVGLRDGAKAPERLRDGARFKQHGGPPAAPMSAAR